MVATTRSRLTPRERDMLLLAASGLTIQQVGRLLHLSVDTVKQSRAHLMRRVGGQNMTHALTRALIDGQLTVDELRAVERETRR